MHERKLFAISETKGPASGHFQWKRENREESVEESSGFGPQAPLRPQDNLSLSKVLTFPSAPPTTEAEKNASARCVGLQEIHEYKCTFSQSQDV